MLTEYARRYPRCGGSWTRIAIRSSRLASFFSDSGHEITTALLPTFVTVTLRSSAAALGLIEGISDALTGLAKLFAGPLANDEQRRLRMASGGYLVTAVATGAIGAATAVWQVGLLRAAAWLARDVRSPARDAMLASLAPREAYGRASGLERAGDNMGAVLGSSGWPLLVLAFLLAGTGIGLAETAESALVAELLPERVRGSGFALLGGVQSFGDFASSAAVGVLCTAVSPAAGFVHGDAWILIAGVATLRPERCRLTSNPSLRAGHDPRELALLSRTIPALHLLPRSGSSPSPTIPVMR